ncbi:MAG: S8 family serine peptidase [Abditibacteriales bacterium]|nr:S8 family serine peptidase [Abditibacteriales bacterium]MDW8365322.1 S8 family serine peptidase [Abditibacteriales bacterium]
MRLTGGKAETAIGLIDGPVVMGHPDLATERIRAVPGGRRSQCAEVRSAACLHGTFVAGILCAHRHSAAPAICPQCTLLVRPIFAESVSANAVMPSAAPPELAEAIFETVEAGARVLNLSVALTLTSMSDECTVEESLNYAARRGVIVVTAAGNQGAVGGSALTRHPHVIPVAACDRQGRPLYLSNLGRSIGQRGVLAPGAGVTSVGADGQPLTMSGTSAAAPFVTGTIALLWSLFPSATAAEVRWAVTAASKARRTTIVPPLLDAWGAYQSLLAANRR